MAKVLVLYHARSAPAALLAEAIAEGARSVRFTEADVRRVAEPAAAEGIARRHRPLDDAHAAAGYDAVVVGSGAGDAAARDELLHPLRHLGPTALADRIGAAFAVTEERAEGTDAPHAATLAGLLTALGELGMLLATPLPSPDAAVRSALGATAGATPTDADLAAARALGARVARVAGWVRHAKGHEGEEGGSHQHHHHH
jgi:hypothetical protein